jgi:thiol-disulfide isomerase/thioredoxin
MAQVNWYTDDEVQELFKQEKRTVIKLHSADWCKHCQKVKAMLDENADFINANWYAIFVDETNNKKSSVSLYPTTMLWTKSGTNIMIEGAFNEELLTALKLQ